MSLIDRWAVPFVAMATLLTGCSTSPAPQLSVALPPNSPQAIDQGLTVAMQAVITNDTSYKGVAWSLSGVGSLSSLTGPTVSYISPMAALV